MNITDKLQKVGVLLAHNRLITVLKQISSSLIAPVECDRIASHKASHDFAQRCGVSPKQDMKMLCEVLYYVKLHSDPL